MVTIALGAGLTRLDFATGQDSYIDPSSEVAKNNERYQELFGGESMVVLFTVPEGQSVVDLFTPANIAQLDEAEQEMLASDAVQSVVSPVALLTWTSDMVTEGVASEIIARTIAREPDPDAAAARQVDATITTLRLGAAGEQSLDNPDWVTFLVFGNDGFTIGNDQQLVAPPDDQLVVRKPLRAFIPDARHAVMAAVLTGNAPLDQLAEGSNAVHEVFDGRTFEPATVTITGTPTFLTDINDYLQGGMLTLGAIAVGVMVIILLVAFKVRWRLLPLIGMAVGTLWGFGAFGFTGTKLSLVTIAGLPILIGLGIEFAIQVQNRIEEERTAGDTTHPFEATLAHMGPALVTATVAAVIAFLTAKISKVPMVQDFGVLLSIGIVALLLAGVVLPTTLIGWRERHSPTTTPPRQSWVETTVVRMGSLPRGAVIPLVVLAIALPIAGLVMETGSKIESDPINWADPASESIQNAHTLEEETGFATTLGIFVETSSADQQRRVHRSDGCVRVRPGRPLARREPRARRGIELGDHRGLAGRGARHDIAAARPASTCCRPTRSRRPRCRACWSPTMPTPRRCCSKSVHRRSRSGRSYSTRCRRRSSNPVTVRRCRRSRRRPPAASPSWASGLLENITANRAELTIAALLLVGAFVVLRSRDLARGLLTMIPVLLAVGTSAVLVRLLSITLSPLTTVGGPLVVATCAEFTVLLVARYAEERDRGHDPEESTRVAAHRTGRAFFTSALTTLGGFAVLMFSSLPLLADFGMVVTINIAVALLSALVVVPPLVKEADRRGLLAMGSAVGRRRGAAAPPDRRSAGPAASCWPCSVERWW